MFIEIKVEIFEAIWYNRNLAFLFKEKLNSSNRILKVDFILL